MGAFDKMAGFNWTNKGLSTAVENYKPEPGKTDTKLDSDKDAPAVSVDSDKVMMLYLQMMIRKLLKLVRM